MKLQYLQLTNFRGFREFEIAFDPSFTVLLGGNMAGKTAVLNGAALAVSPVLGSLRVRDIEDDEVHRVTTSSGGIPELQRTFPVIIDAKIINVGTGPGWERWKLRCDKAGGGTRIDNIANTVFKRSLEEDLPVIAQYGVQRHWDRNKPADDVRDIGSRYDAYESCFNISSTQAKLAGWMRKQTFVQLQRSQLQHNDEYVQPQLSAVEAAVKSCIDGITRFWFDLQHEELRLERTGGDIQSFGMLSEGYRNMVALAADIAWRASVLNPHHGAAAHLRTGGVVLIDELDLHLHPAWQRRVVADLRRTFPNIQFIVTTHSPQIVASVKREQVRLLDRNQLASDKPYVEGRDSSEILEDVFGVPARPEEVKGEIKEVYQLIEAAKFAEARTRLDNLEERLGPHDAELVRVRWLLDTEDRDPLASSVAST